MRAHERQKYFIIEGNIGAGKSTFLKIIKNYVPLNAVLEPHEKWQNVGGVNLFNSYYNDTSRWAYTFQTYVLMTRILEQEAKARYDSNCIQLLERSIYSDRYCFAENCYELGFMNDLEWQLYLEFFSSLTHAHALKPTGFIYLRTDPLVCYERLIKRNRFEERGVSLEYLQRLHAKHEAWLLGDSQTTPVLVLPCNVEFETNKDIQKNHSNSIQQFLDNL